MPLNKLYHIVTDLPDLSVKVIEVYNMERLKKSTGLKMDENLCLDWISFTYKPDLDDQDHIIDKFLAEFKSLRSLYNDGIAMRANIGYYQNMLVCAESIRISYDADNNDHGVNVMVPSHGISLIYDCLIGDKVYSAKKLLSYLVDHSCIIGRIDLAYDDYSMTYMPKYYADQMISSNIVSNFRYWSYMSSCSSKESDTFYLGRRAKDKFVRIYNKKVESDGDIPAIRYEVELKHKTAHATALYLINNDFDFANYWINNIFKVVDNHYSDRNRAHAAIDSDWSEFINGSFATRSLSEPIKIKLPKKPVSFDRLYNWIDNYVMPSLVTYCECIGLNQFYDQLQNCDRSNKFNDLIVSNFNRFYGK